MAEFKLEPVEKIPKVGHFDKNDFTESLDEQVQDFINSIIKDRPNLHLKPEKKLIGISEKTWKVDYAICKDNDIVIIIEIKDTKASYATFRNQIQRAYSELGDLQNYNCIKFIIVPYEQKSKGFDFRKYVKTIGVTLLDWSVIEDRHLLEENIKKN